MARTRMIGLIVILALASGAQSAAAYAHVDLCCYSDRNVDCDFISQHRDRFFAGG